MMFWIICGLIIYASTLVMVNRKMGTSVPMNNESLLLMVTFAVLGPISIVLGSMILNDFNN